MKKTYINPSTTCISIQSVSICQTVVGSVHGDSGLGFGGGGGTGGSKIEPN